MKNSFHRLNLSDIGKTVRQYVAANTAACATPVLFVGRVCFQILTSSSSSPSSKKVSRRDTSSEFVVCNMTLGKPLGSGAGGEVVAFISSLMFVTLTLITIGV